MFKGNFDQSQFQFLIMKSESFFSNISFINISSNSLLPVFSLQESNFSLSHFFIIESNYSGNHFMTSSNCDKFLGYHLLIEK